MDFPWQLGKLHILEVFCFYDAPRSFSCINKAGQRFVAHWVGELRLGDEYLYVPVSESRLLEALDGKINLRDLFLKSEDEIVYWVRHDWRTHGFDFKQIKCKEIELEDLPTDDSIMLLPDKHVLSVEESA